MSRTAYKFSAVIVSLLLGGALAGCGSSNKEGTTNPAEVARVADEAVCRTCHGSTLDPVSNTPIVADFNTTTNSHNQPGRANTDLGCEGCHGGGIQHNGVGPIPFPDPLNVVNPDGTTTRCIICHTTTAGALAPTTQNLNALFDLAKPANGGFVNNNCAHCHTSSGAGSVHGAMVPETDNCVFCHAVAAPNHGTGLVNDNSGVRAVVTEFAKWSHHVTGVDLNAAHCAACHLEGTVVNGAIVVDPTKHMTDATVHLRNADDDSEFSWDPATPNFTNMDNFCMSCHDANGATSPMSLLIQGVINRNGLTAAGKSALPSNPFGDTISNRYDKMQRPAVVNAKDQFATTNNSHHGVRGKRYTGRTRVAGAVRAIASPATFASNSTAILQGARSTIFDAGNFNALYSPLGTDGTAATGLGDDSTLHCGDCHTVGQWKPNASDNAKGSPSPAAIGAHGSNNEYLLRNTLGTDERHTQNAFLQSAANVVTYTNPNGAFLVCYNCHSYTRYGSIYVGTGLNIGNGNQPHAGEYDQQGRCNGIGNTLPFNGYTTGIATDGSLDFSTRFTSLANTQPAPYAGEQNPDFGNVFGIQCLNCHNSGVGNAYGGIHGSANNTSWNNGTTTISPAASVLGGAYIDGMGNTNKVERFLPGLGDVMHVPGTLGGFTPVVAGTPLTVIGPITNTDTYTYVTGAISNDTNWEQKAWTQKAGTVFNLTTGVITGAGNVGAGAGCYTLGATQALPANIVSSDVSSGLRGPSQTGAGGPATTLVDNWGACDDHTAGQGRGNHGFVKRIVRPVTY